MEYKIQLWTFSLDVRRGCTIIRSSKSLPKIKLRSGHSLLDFLHTIYLKNYLMTTGTFPKSSKHRKQHKVPWARLEYIPLLQWTSSLSVNLIFKTNPFRKQPEEMNIKHSKMKFVVVIFPVVFSKWLHTAWVQCRCTFSELWYLQTTSCLESYISEFLFGQVNYFSFLCPSAYVSLGRKPSLLFVSVLFIFRQTP